MSSEMMKWPYLPGLGSFRDEMNKLFENFTGRGAGTGMSLVTPLDVSEKEEKGKNYHFVERSYGSFSRSVELPASVKFNQVKAEYKKGILEITLPKSEKTKTKKIPVKVN